MEAAIALLGGAALGVLLDRLYWLWVESRPCIQVHASCSYGIDGQHFILEITNLGMTQLAPYEVALFNPHGGTVGVFQHKQISERLPHQKDTFSFGVPTIPDEMRKAIPEETLKSELGQQLLAVVSANKHAEQRVKELHTVLLRTLTNKRGGRMSDQEFGEWRLRLILKHSDNFVLFEDRRVGVAIAKIVRGIVESGAVEPDGDLLWCVRAHNSWRRAISRWFWRSRRQRKALAALVGGPQAVQSAQGTVTTVAS